MNSHAELSATLVVVLRAAGRPVPCMDTSAEARRAWTSDDHAEQSIAARLCAGCAGLAGCRRFIEDHPDEWGVYAGSVDRDRHRRPVPRAGAKEAA